MDQTPIDALEAGDGLYGRYAVLARSLRPFRDPAKGRFLTLTLGDSSGTLGAKVWDGADAIAEAIAGHEVVEVEGRLEEWGGSLQATLLAVRPVPPEEVDPAQFLPRGPRDPDKCLKWIREVVEEDVDCPSLRALLFRFLDDDETREALLVAPAAKNRHHAYLGGLVEHIASALTIGRSVCRVHPALDRSLVHAGIVLHDIGKVLELTVRATIDYAPRGRLIGHIVLGYEWVMREAEAIEGFPEETLMLLGHIILSHHGKAEYGAPVVPMTAEAEAVHQIENLDAQLNHMTSAVREARAEGREYSEYDRLLGRYFYAGTRPAPTDDA